MHKRKEKEGSDGKPCSTSASERREENRRRNDQAERAISIGQLNALPRLHLRPINVVVFDGP